MKTLTVVIEVDTPQDKTLDQAITRHIESNPKLKVVRIADGDYVVELSKIYQEVLTK